MLQSNSSNPKSPRVQAIISKYSDDRFDPLLSFTQSENTDVLDYTFTSENRVSNEQPLQFQNPIGLRWNDTTDVAPKQDNENNRITFGVQNPGDIFFMQMNKVKERVLDLLNKSSLRIRQHNQKQIKWKLQQESQLIKKDYDALMLKFKNENIIINNPQQKVELQMMINLIQEFLRKLGSNSHQQSQKSQLSQQSQQSQQSLQSKQNQMQQKMKSEISLVKQFPDETFYKEKKLNKEYIQKKLETLKEKLKEELKNDKYPYTQIILDEMIQNLEDVIQVDDNLIVKSIIFKLQNGIQRLQQSKIQNLNLYQLLKKAIKNSQKKLMNCQNLSLSPIQPKKQSQSNRNIVIKEYNCKKRNSEYVSFGESKRIFFDKAFTKKNNLDKNHPGRQKMVYELYDEFVRQQLPDSAIEEFLEQQL